MVYTWLHPEELAVPEASHCPGPAREQYTGSWSGVVLLPIQPIQIDAFCLQGSVGALSAREGRGRAWMHRLRGWEEGSVGVPLVLFTNTACCFPGLASALGLCFCSKVFQGLF